MSNYELFSSLKDKFFNKKSMSDLLCVCDSNPFSPLSCQFSSLLFNPKFSDFSLVHPNAPHGKQHRIPVHRFLLDARCQYFHDFFLRTPKEKNLSLCFPDWASEEVYLVLRYLYTSECILLTDSNISGIYYIAFSWGAHGLCKICEDYLETSVSPGSSLEILWKLESLFPENSGAFKNLVNSVISNFVLFSPDQFALLSYPLFKQITGTVYHSIPDDTTANSLCNAIEKYIQDNIVSLGKNEFEFLLRKFTMKTYHSGVVSLYKICLKQKWLVKFCENKILHSWWHIDQDKLSKLPISKLEGMLKKNYLNVRCEDEILDFLCLTQTNHPGEDVSPLWEQLRVTLLSPEGFQRFIGSPLVPPVLKVGPYEEKSNTSLRLPRFRIKCLILGAADNKSLEDVRNMLSYSWFSQDNLTVARADCSCDIDFSLYHAVFVFSFYKYCNASDLSKKLASYYQQGGGIVVAFGGHRPDDFGLGEPLLSMMPIDPYKQESVKSDNIQELITASDIKGERVGCKHMRLLCKAKDYTEITTVWDDSVPFIVATPPNNMGGRIVVFNATPVSSDIIPDQWSKNDKSMVRLLADAVVSVANKVVSPGM